MATAEALQSHPRRSRHFPSWIRKLASFKKTESKKKTVYSASSRRRATSSDVNNSNGTEQARPTPALVAQSIPSSSTDHAVHSEQVLRSAAPTISTTAEPEHVSSEVAQSHGASSVTGTTATIGPGKGTGSTFSSPAPSERSLATTLTTIQSANAAVGIPAISSPAIVSQNSNTSFAHQFPSSPHPTAIPAHLTHNTSGGHPATYNTLTANNLLTDNASILTLASSSKRRRRRSMDTDASVRAVAPSSLFGGSRESLPLSVLSPTTDSVSLQPGVHSVRQAGGGAAERASIYSATGVTPALPSDRNSYYAGRERVIGDGVSVKSGMSGLYGHGRTESLSGSVGVLNGGSVHSPLASPTLTRGTT